MTEITQAAANAAATMLTDGIKASDTEQGQKATDQKTAVDTATVPGTDPNKPADKAPAEGATDKGEDKGAKEGDQKKPDEVVYVDVKAPDGLEVEPESLKEFNGLAKEAKISTEQAQKIVDWYAKHNQVVAQNQVKVWEDTQKTWVEQAKTDKEIGGEKFDSTVTSAKAAIKKFGNERFLEALNFSGLGNHPEMIRFLNNVAKAFGEDKLVIGSPGSGDAKVSIADKLFPNQNK